MSTDGYYHRESRRYFGNQNRRPRAGYRDNYRPRNSNNGSRNYQSHNRTRPGNRSRQPYAYNRNYQYPIRTHENHYQPYPQDEARENQFNFEPVQFIAESGSFGGPNYWPAIYQTGTFASAEDGYAPLRYPAADGSLLSPSNYWSDNANFWWEEHPEAEPPRQHPYHHYWRPQTGGEIRCIVCLEDYDKVTNERGESIKSSRCGHLFCTRCLNHNFFSDCWICCERVGDLWTLFA